MPPTRRPGRTADLNDLRNGDHAALIIHFSIRQAVGATIDAQGDISDTGVGITELIHPVVLPPESRRAKGIAIGNIVNALHHSRIVDEVSKILVICPSSQLNIAGPLVARAIA